MEPIKADVVVLGAGPGGYAAAFYAADKGRDVILIEQDPNLGGVCLNRGCIPSKALLHATHSLRDMEHSKRRGIEWPSTPTVHVEQLRAWKDSVIERLRGGIKQLADKRGVQVIIGRGHFEDSQTLRVETEQGQQFIEFQKAIVAVGSSPAMPAAFDLGNKRIMTSTEALELEDVPQELLVVGGGYIGMELGTVYASLGSRVVLLEAMDSLLAGADPDLARPVLQYARANFKEVRVKTKVSKMATKGKQVFVVSENEEGQKEELFDRVLVSVGRKPNTKDLGLKNTAVKVDAKGFIEVNNQLQTTDANIYAIGDVVGGAMLAHKASKEARLAVEAILGEPVSSEGVIIPAVVFTDPEVAWCGLTESEARAQNLPVEVAKFPWGASGRALAIDRTDGLTKLILEKETGRILGVGIVGAGAGELISEGVLAIEMGATAEDMALSVHPHPTLSETLMESAESFYGLATHSISRRPASVTS